MGIEKRIDELKDLICFRIKRNRERADRVEKMVGAANDRINRGSMNLATLEAYLEEALGVLDGSDPHLLDELRLEGTAEKESCEHNCNCRGML